MELSDRRIVEWWNGEVGGVIESSEGGKMELVELSNHQMVEWWSWLSIRIFESLDGRIVEWWS